jgi:hypothetical protein
MGGYDAVSTDPYSNGFGDVLNTAGYLHNFDGTLFAGTLVTNLSLDFDDPLNGADLWRASGSADNVQWIKVNDDGFGDTTVLSFETFTEFDSTLYVSASTVNPSNFSEQEPDNASGAKIYRMVSDGSCTDSDSDGECDTSDADTVYGTISGDIQAGITVKIYRTTCGADVFIATTTTDQNGYYSFGDLESGNLLVVPTASGYSFVPIRSWPVIPQDVIQSYDFTAVED